MDWLIMTTMEKISLIWDQIFQTLEEIFKEILQIFSRGRNNFKPDSDQTGTFS